MSVLSSLAMAAAMIAPSLIKSSLTRQTSATKLSTHLALASTRKSPATSYVYAYQLTQSCSYGVISCSGDFVLCYLYNDDHCGELQGALTYDNGGSQKCFLKQGGDNFKIASIKCPS